VAARTYIPQLRKFLTHINKYLARWTPLIIGNLTDVQAAALLAFQLALAELIDKLGAETVGP